MKPKKEHYRGNLPHFQQPGQWYSVTCSLEGAMPKSVMDKYTEQLKITKTRYLNLLGSGSGLGKDSENRRRDSHSSGKPDFSIQTFDKEKGFSLSQRDLDFPKSVKAFEEAGKDYYNALREYRYAYDKFLNNSKEPNILLIKENNRVVIVEALKSWEGIRLTSFTWCIMSNHFHWVLSVFEKDEHGKSVYLQDILHSVKLFTARRINENENRKGQLWVHESFETTIRNDRHFMNVVNYIINNPVSAGLVKDWKEWEGTFVEDGTRTFLSP